MRNLTRNSVQDESASNNSAAAEKSSAKKLKQARLPFKVITPSTSPVVGSKSASTATATGNDKDDHELRNHQSKEQQVTDGRKRKLSCDDDNESLDVLDGDDNVSKENVEILAAATKKKKISTISNNEISPEVVSLLEDDDDDDDHDDHGDDDDIVEINQDMPNTSASNVASKQDSLLKTPKVIAKEKRKGAAAPRTRSMQKEKSGSASKLQIKLPLSADKKNKRRKSKLQQFFINNSSGAEDGSHNNSAQELSSDDIEENVLELNPQKRKKPNDEDLDEKEEETECKTLDIGNAIAVDSEPEAEKEEEEDEQKEERKSTPTTSKGIRSSEKCDNESLKKSSQRDDHKIKTRGTKTANNDSEKREKSKETSISFKDDVAAAKDSPKKISKVSEEEKNRNANLDLDIGDQSENEADDEIQNKTVKSVNISSDVSDDVKSSLNTTVDPQTDGHNTSVTGKTLTPKQIKHMEQRRKAREEKERKLQEEKMKRQQEKEERELAKKREREEKEDQKRREREEKEEQKRKEREDKERKRLAEIEAKNEEKRKRNEAKEEELRKKEEERKRKEQEKEEAELKKKKAAQAFTKFFVAKAPTSNQLKNDDDSNTEDGTKLLAFRPFQVKGDMKLAPICRKIFTPEDKNRLDMLFDSTNKGDEDDEEDIVRRKPLPKSQLYLSELQSGKIIPGKWRRPSTESKDDVIILEDELERVGQAIIEDTPDYVREQMRVKFYKFHDNRRPPYYGTWRKKSAVVKSRRPFAQDKKIFDYDVDSDDEWEEEEPGESLEDGSDDDKEKESEDDDYEVDNEWFVPHGHLSDEELQNEDENGLGNDNTREAQKVKLQILQQEFAQEMKKKTEKIKPRLIGCIWADIDGNQPSNCANILWDALEKKAMLLTEPPVVEEMETENSVETTSPSSNANNNQDKLKSITLSDNMIKDLIRVIHGNNHSKNFLINEYIAYIEKTEASVKNGDLRKPSKSVIRDKIDEMAEWQVVNATASSIQDMEQNSEEPTENNKKKKKCKRRLCWVVKQDILDKMNLSSLELHNSWKYTLKPKFVKAEKHVKTEENAETTSATSAAIGECNSARVTEAAEDNTAKGKEKKSTRSKITKFAKVLTADEKTKKLQNAKPPASPNITIDKTATETKTSKERKRVPLLMSVARGQQISTPAKNKLISQFLQQKSKEKLDMPKHSSPTTSARLRTATASPIVEDDDVVILD